MANYNVYLTKHSLQTQQNHSNKHYLHLENVIIIKQQSTLYVCFENMHLLNTPIEKITPRPRK